MNIKTARKHKVKCPKCHKKHRWPSGNKLCFECESNKRLNTALERQAIFAAVWGARIPLEEFTGG